MATTTKQEIIDQTAHFVIGFIVVFMFQYIMTGVLAFTLLVAGSFIRELFQNGRFFELHKRSWFDMLFWILGGITGLVLF
jgi:uncharacterized membrane protein